MNNAAAVVFDNLAEFARECLGIADEAVVKVAALEKEVADLKAREALVLTKVATPVTVEDPELPLDRVAGTVDKLIKTAFIRRSNRSDTIDGIRYASKETLFEILEKLASIAICPVSAMQMGDDGELVEKAAGQPGDEPSDEGDVWLKSWKETKAELGS